MRFIEINRQLVNVDYIERVERFSTKDSDDKRVYKVIVHLRGGETISAVSNPVLEQHLDDLQKVGPVAAHPGFFIMHLSGDDDAVVETEPVVAWMFGVTGTAYPMGAEGGAEDNNAVRWPDGRIVQWGDRTFEDEESWRAEMLSRRKSRGEP